MAIFNHGLPVRANVISEGGTDTSKDTVTPETLLKGVTAHDASGAQITGTLDTEAIRAEGVEAGKKSECDALWDAFQQNGTRTDYGRAFAFGWSTETFDPNFPLVPEGEADYMFYYSKIGNADDPDFDFVERGIELDLSKVTRMTYGFAYARGIKRLGVIDFSGYTTNVFNRIFWSTQIETIDKLVVTDGTEFDHTFDYSKKLKNLIIEGTIGKNGLNLSWSPLSKTSIISVINALSDTTTDLAVTLRMSALKTAFETSEGAADGNSSEEWLALVATKPNWAITAVDNN